MSTASISTASMSTASMSTASTSSSRQSPRTQSAISAVNRAISSSRRRTRNIWFRTRFRASTSVFASSISAGEGCGSGRGIFFILTVCVSLLGDRTRRTKKTFDSRCTTKFLKKSWCTTKFLKKSRCTTKFLKKSRCTTKFLKKSRCS